MAGPYRANTETHPTIEDLPVEEGWIRMQVQFLIDEDHGGAENMVVGRTIFPPGSCHELHRHPRAEEFVFIMRGHGIVLDGDDEIEVGPGDVVLHRAGHWHGLRNASDSEPVEVFWAWSGGASKAEAGYDGNRQEYFSVHV